MRVIQNSKPCKERREIAEYFFCDNNLPLIKVEKRIEISMQLKLIQR